MEQEKTPPQPDEECTKIGIRQNKWELEPSLVPQWGGNKIKTVRPTWATEFQIESFQEWSKGSNFRVDTRLSGMYLYSQLFRRLRQDLSPGFLNEVGLTWGDIISKQEKSHGESQVVHQPSVRQNNKYWRTSLCPGTASLQWLHPGKQICYSVDAQQLDREWMGTASKSHITPHYYKIKPSWLETVL